MKNIFLTGILISSIFLNLKAQHTPTETGVGAPHSHAPIGVMGDHLHKKGEFMVSYRFMRMRMEGNRTGTDQIDSETIVTTEANPFAGMPMMPPTLRVIPLDMDMTMHMFGVMYAPTDWITIMGMTMVNILEMEHTTFQGGMGTNELGNFTTRSSGLGDSRLTALVKIADLGVHHFHFNAGLGLPTGSITKEDEILTPMEARPTVRIPYPMQLGSGTFDLMPGVTYYAVQGKIGWGAQVMGTFRLGENDEDYTLGNYGQLTAWGSYQLAPWISSSLRLTGLTQGTIDGQDPQIMAPVQTADPERQGGERVDVSLGINLIGQSGMIKSHRLALEFNLPTYQDLNGPQLETDWTITAGWQYAFK